MTRIQKPSGGKGIRCVSRTLARMFQAILLGAVSVVRVEPRTRRPAPLVQACRNCPLLSGIRIPLSLTHTHTSSHGPAPCNAPSLIIRSRLPGHSAPRPLPRVPPPKARAARRRVESAAVGLSVSLSSSVPGPCTASSGWRWLAVHPDGPWLHAHGGGRRSHTGPRHRELVGKML